MEADREEWVKRYVLSILLLAIPGIVIACVSNQSSPEAGQNLTVLKGCSACHAVDDTYKIGPTWVGLYGSQVELDDGSFVTADEAYLVESIRQPNAKIVRGFTKGAMPLISLSDEEISALLAYIMSVK